LYLAHVTLLTPAQSLLKICSGLPTFVQAKYHFRQAAPQHAVTIYATRTLKTEFLTVAEVECDRHNEV